MAIALLTVNVQKDVCRINDAPAVIEKIKALRNAYSFKVVAHIRTMHSTNHHSFQSSNPGCSLLDKAPGSEARHHRKESTSSEQKTTPPKREKTLLQFHECITKDYCVLGTDGANFSDELPVFDTDVIIDFLDGQLSADSRATENVEPRREDGLPPRRNSGNINGASLPFINRIFHGNDITNIFIAGFGFEGTILRTVLDLRRLLGNEMQITVLTDACCSMGNIYNAAADQAKVDNMLRMYCNLSESYNIAVPDELRKLTDDSKKKKKKRVLKMGSLASKALQESRTKFATMDVVPPLHKAVLRGNVDEVRRMLKEQSSMGTGALTPNSPSQREIDSMIMKHDCFGNSAVVLACQVSHNPIVAYQILSILLSRCSNHILPLATNIPGWADMTPLMHAVVQQNHRMVELLLWKGATVDSQKVATCGKNVLAFALSTMSPDFERAINIANTLITRVIRAHTFEADEVTVNSNGDSEDKFAAFAREEQGFDMVDQRAVEKAINYLADLFVQPDTRGWSCIHHAAKTDFLSRLSLVPFGAHPGTRANLNLVYCLCPHNRYYTHTHAHLSHSYSPSHSPSHSHSNAPCHPGFD